MQTKDIVLISGAPATVTETIEAKSKILMGKEAEKAAHLTILPYEEKVKVLSSKILAAQELSIPIDGVNDVLNTVISMKEQHKAHETANVEVVRAAATSEHVITVLESAFTAVRVDLQSPCGAARSVFVSLDAVLQKPSTSHAADASLEKRSRKSASAQHRIVMLAGVSKTFKEAITWSIRKVQKALKLDKQHSPTAELEITKPEETEQIIGIMETEEAVPVLLNIAGSVESVKIQNVTVCLVKQGEATHQELVIAYEGKDEAEAEPADSTVDLVFDSEHSTQADVFHSQKPRCRPSPEELAEPNVVAVFVEVDADCPDQAIEIVATVSVPEDEAPTSEPEPRAELKTQRSFSISESVSTAALQMPKFSRKLTDKQATPGEPTVFKCIVSGIPMPEIRWTVDGDLIEENEDYTLIFEDGVCILKIKETLPEDEGEYQCEAKNAAGKVATNCFLKVLDAAAFVIDHRNHCVQHEPVRSRLEHHDSDTDFSLHRIASYNADLHETSAFYKYFESGFARVRITDLVQDAALCATLSAAPAKRRRRPPPVPPRPSLHSAAQTVLDAALQRPPAAEIVDVIIQDVGGLSTQSLAVSPPSPLSELWKWSVFNPFEHAATKLVTHCPAEPRVPALPPKVLYKGQEIGITSTKKKIIHENPRDPDYVEAVQRCVEAMFDFDAPILPQPSGRRPRSPPSEIEESAASSLYPASSDAGKALDTSMASSLPSSPTKEPRAEPCLFDRTDLEDIERSILCVAERLSAERTVSRAHAEAKQELLRATLADMILHPSSMILHPSSTAAPRSEARSPMQALRDSLDQIEDSLMEEVPADVEVRHLTSSKKPPTPASLRVRRVPSQELLRMTPLTTNIREQLTVLENLLDSVNNAGESTIHDLFIQINAEIITIKQYCSRKMSKKGTDAVIAVLRKVKAHIASIVNILHLTKQQQLRLQEPAQAEKQSPDMEIRPPPIPPHETSKLISVAFQLRRKEQCESAFSTIIFKSFTRSRSDAMTSSSIPQTSAQAEGDREATPVPPPRRRRTQSRERSEPKPPPRKRRSQSRHSAKSPQPPDANLLQPSRQHRSAAPSPESRADSADVTETVDLAFRRRPQTDHLNAIIITRDHLSEQGSTPFLFDSAELLCSPICLSPKRLSRASANFEVVPEEEALLRKELESLCRQTLATPVSALPERPPTPNPDRQHSEESVREVEVLVPVELPEVEVFCEQAFTAPEPQEQTALREIPAYIVNAQNSKPSPGISYEEGIDSNEMLFVMETRESAYEQQSSSFRNMLRHPTRDETSSIQLVCEESDAGTDTENSGFMRGQAVGMPPMQARDFEGCPSPRKVSPPYLLFKDENYVLDESDLTSQSEAVSLAAPLALSTITERTEADSVETLRRHGSDETTNVVVEESALSEMAALSPSLQETAILSDDDPAFESVARDFKLSRRQQRCALHAAVHPDVRLLASARVAADHSFDVIVQHINQAFEFRVHVYAEVVDCTALTVLLDELSERQPSLPRLDDFTETSSFDDFEEARDLSEDESVFESAIGVTVSIVARSMHDIVDASLEEIPWGEVAMSVPQCVMLRSVDSDSRMSSVQFNVTVSESTDAEKRRKKNLKSQDSLAEDEKTESGMSLNIPSYVIKLGSTATITCELNNYLPQESRIEWMKGRELVRRQPGKVDRISHDLLEVLVISCVAMSDTDIYSLVVDDEAFPVAYLVVEEAQSEDEASARFMSPAQTLFVMDGQPAVLSVRVSDPQQNVAWFKERRPLTQTAGVAFLAADDGVQKLVIASTSVEDQGTYYAYIGDNYTAITLVVEERIDERELTVVASGTESEHEDELREYLVPPGSTATIACELEPSDKARDVVWRKDGRAIDFADEAKLEHVVNGLKHYLVIHDTEATDSGVYAVAIHGVEFRVAHLAVSDMASAHTNLRRKRISNSSLA